MSQVRVETAGGVMTVTLADVENRNALGAALLQGLAQAIERANADASVRAVVITNEGSTFCAGANLKEQSGVRRASGPSVTFDALLSAIQRSPLPIIGRIAGHVVGGGNGLAAALDIAIAADDVKFGFTEVRLGVIPAIISVVCLPKMRRGEAMEAFLRGNRFPAARAAELGLISRAVPRDQLDAAVAEVIDDLRQGGPAALGLAKRLVYEVPAMEQKDAFAYTSQLSAELFRGAEAAEGMKAFLEKRPAAWAKAAVQIPTLQESTDLCAEADELHGFLRTLAPADWERATQFMGWTPWDVVAHLHFFDEMSLAALEGPETFKARRDALIADLGRRRTNQQIARERYAGVAASELLERWITGCREMAKQLGESNPDRRLPWFGPDMGVRMFTTARLMETWAHGQEIYDLVGARRKPTDRLKHIATIGVKTFGWTFANRGLAPPGPPPYVRLVAPSGAVWEWNERSESERVEGDALDFCLVVTQARNVKDTRLRVTGDVATRWMQIAQCFAGGPVDPPKKGERGV